MPNNINHTIHPITNSLNPSPRPGLRNLSFIFILAAALFVTGCAVSDDLDSNNPPIPPQVDLKVALQQGGSDNLVSLETTVRCLINFCSGFIVTFYRSADNVTGDANDEKLGTELPELFVNGQEINITFAPPLACRTTAK